MPEGSVDHWFYAEFVGRPKQGSKNPIFVDCSYDPTFPEFTLTVLVKPSGDPTQQAREYLGNRMAQAFGLRTPTPMLVHLNGDDLRSLEERYGREGRFLGAVLPILAGSLKVPLGTNPPLATGFDVDLLPDALRLFAFDMLTHYADRTESNPNFSWVRDGLLAFDFEQCFPPEVRLMGEGPLWTPCARGLAPVHCLHRHLRGRVGSLVPAREGLDALMRQDWRRLVDELPDSWREEALRILDHLLQFGAHRKEFEDDLRRSLT